MASPVTIVVVDHGNRYLPGAQVRAGDASTVTDERGRASLEAEAGTELRVEAADYEGQSRILRARDLKRTQRFMLGPVGMPYFYRGRGRVPFEPLPGVVGIAAAHGAGQAGAGRPFSAGSIAERVAGRLLRTGGNFAESGIAIVQLPATAEPEQIAETLAALSADPAVADAGAVVRLSEKHASFLTNLVIARFEDGVDDARVAEIAGRHGLTSEGRFKPLGNVHRLRFAGPATYAVLDAANALAEEPEVVYSEPNLVHTSEDDAVVPTDFLFPEQWDHKLIDTPGAWQALRDIDPARTFGDPDLVIAVLDRGVDADHPELSGNVSSGVAKRLGLFDFVRMEPDTDFPASDHGMGCTSAALANANNASPVAGVQEGIAGVAGNCRYLGLQRRSVASDAHYADVYLWAGGFDPGSTEADFPAQLARGADIISSSFGLEANEGDPISTAMVEAFDQLTDEGRGGRGVLLFFSAGNDGRRLDDFYDRPWSMHDRCFGVAASTLATDGISEVRATYSNFGTTVDWCVPASSAFVTDIHNPPTVYGAVTASRDSDSNTHVTCGHPAQQTSLAAAAAAGSTVLTLASAAGFAVGQAVLAGTPGAAFGRRVVAVNAGANQITLDAGLGKALPAGVPIVSGPRTFRTNFGGTSYATPVAAGIGALMLSANPDLRWDEVRELLCNTAVKIDAGNTDPNGRWVDAAGLTLGDPGYAGPRFSEFYGFGRLDAAAAVRAAGTRIELATLAIEFNDVPTGETAYRAVRFNVRSAWQADFEILSPPLAPFTLPFGPPPPSPGTANPDTVREVLVWIAYTGGAVGDTASGSITVRNAQTGRRWTVPIDANTVERKSACVMLCLDRSGSMAAQSGVDGATRIEVLRYSARILVDTAREGDALGIVAFDHDAHDVEPTPLGPLGPVTAPDMQRDTLRTTIDDFDFNPSGMTAIGDGLERAQLRLDPVSGYDTKSTILFTDGFETAEKYISQVQDSLTDRVFAVALGRAEDIQPTALAALTGAREGYVTLTGQLDNDSRYKLAKYFLQVLAGVNNEEVVVDPDGWLGPEQVHDIGFDLAETDISADVILMNPGPGLIEMTLLTPGGEEIDAPAALALPGALYFEGANVSYYRLALPAPFGGGAREGRWHARLRSGRRAKDGITHSKARRNLPYSLLVHSHSNLRMATTLGQSGFAPGATLHMRAMLTEYGVPVEGRATVAAWMKEPDGSETKVPLAETAPGRFECAIAAPVPGTYEIRAMAQGRTLNGRHFTREAVRTGAVWIGGDRPVPGTGGQTLGSACGRLLEQLCSEWGWRRLKFLLTAAILATGLIIVLLIVLLILVLSAD